MGYSSDNSHSGKVAVIVAILANDFSFHLSSSVMFVTFQTSASES